MSAHSVKTNPPSKKGHVSIDPKRETSVWADLQSISRHAKAVSGIKRVIKESLVIQISHAYGAMSESRWREHMVKNHFKLREEGRK